MGGEGREGEGRGGGEGWVIREDVRGGGERERVVLFNW